MNEGEIGYLVEVDGVKISMEEVMLAQTTP